MSIELLSDPPARRAKTDKPAEEMPLPSNPRTILLVGIFVLMVFYTLYFAREVVIPILFAFILSLLLRPAMQLLTRTRLPRTLAALVTILLFFGLVVGFGASVSGPTQAWIAKAPESLSRLEQRVSNLTKPLGELQEMTQRVEELAQGKQPTVAVRNEGGLGSLLLLNTQSFMVGLGITIVLLFFLLAAGDMFLRRLVEIMPTFSNKKQVVEISQEIERNISGYLFTITAMNAAVGILTGSAAWLYGMSDPILWGVAAFLLNFLPIFGPLLGCAMLFLAALVTFDTAWRALLPAVTYLCIHFLEGETITPMLLARRFTLNPVLVIISIVFWYWMWGVAGALLAVPVLATVKIISDRVRPLAAFGHFLGAEPRS